MGGGPWMEMLRFTRRCFAGGGGWIKVSHGFRKSYIRICLLILCMHGGLCYRCSMGWLYLGCAVRCRD